MKKVKTKNRPQFENTRKVLRKQKRQLKKANRKDHYLKKKNGPSENKYVPGKYVKRPNDMAEIPTEIKKKISKPSSIVQNIISRERQKEIKEANKLKNQMDEQRRQLLLKANEEEDQIIKKLEKRLGLNKSKNKNNYFADDGLDYLLEVCDKSTTEQIVAAEKHLAEVEGDSDFEEDLAVVTGKEADKSKKRQNSKRADIDEDLSEDGSNINSDGSGIDENASDEDVENFDNDIMDEDSEFGEEEESDESEAPEEKPNKPSKSKADKIKKEDKQNKIESKLKVVSEDNLSKVFSDDEISHLSGDSDNDDLDDNIDDENDEMLEMENKKEKPDVWEDIYGRKRDKEGNVIKEEKGVYIPPHLRNKDSSSDKQLLQLKKQIKSVLNKLAGTNLHWACTTIENLYNNNSRNSVNSGLSQLWLEAIVGPSVTPDRMVAEHAALVSVLHANVGSEIGAHFLQELSKKFDDMMQTPQPVEDKRLDNLVSCLAHLYSFKIYQASLLYDLLSRLLDELSEKNIECVIVALRNVGGVLRKEEPLALKNFIHETQGKVAKMKDDAAAGSRIKFLLEVLMAVKNNNLTKIPNYDPTYMEHLKKMTKGVIRRGNYVTPLNIRLEDLLKADERGKWWVVGSAWEGNRIQQEEKPANKLLTKDQKLLELARKQRMNTDVRRSIFCVIMSSEDFMDAFEKLQHLGLKGQQEREIVHVLLACCLQEKTYNPYYAVLGQKLCDTDRKYQLSIQYSVWDKIKDIENLPKHATTNLAQFLIHLFMERGLPVSVLKIIQFSELNKHTVKFMRQILLAIIMNADFESALQVFHRISKSPKLHMFRESLKLFIQHFLIKNAGKKTSILSDEEMATLKTRSLEVDKILTMYDSKLKF